MKTVVQDMYRGWNITVKAEEQLCSKFSFEITDPSGRSQIVTLGGDNEKRALERAREMIDMECDIAEEE